MIISSIGWSPLPTKGRIPVPASLRSPVEAGCRPGKGQTLKGQCHKIVDFWFFYESVSPIRAVSNFFEIRGDIHSSRCNTGVIDTGGKWKKSSIMKVLIIL
jgi:hypothetical protein